MAVTVSEVKAHLLQGASQLQTFEFLLAQDSDRVATCDVLHLLQMATENIAKAIRLQSNPGWNKYQHAVFAHIPQHLRDQRKAKVLGYSNWKAYQGMLDGFRAICAEIEQLHPQVGQLGQEGPNVEYPWPGRDASGEFTFVAPCQHVFPVYDKLRSVGRGAQLITFIKLLIQRFDHVFV